jgi:hypothetical protein
VSLPAITNMRLVPHAATCPECGSTDVGTDQVDLGDGIEETAYVCEAPGCGCAWPLACICEWSTHDARR